MAYVYIHTYIFNFLGEKNIVLYWSHTKYKKTLREWERNVYLYVFSIYHQTGGRCRQMMVKNSYDYRKTQDQSSMILRSTVGRRRQEASDTQWFQVFFGFCCKFHTIWRQSELKVIKNEGRRRKKKVDRKKENSSAYILFELDTKTLIMRDF